jgi:predicted GNAT family acetyltransferase
MLDDPAMAYTLRHRPEQGRYELHDADGPVGTAAYVERGDEIVIHHTEIRPDRRGAGLGGRMVGLVLDDLRLKGQRLVPACPFVRSYVAGHPGYADLLA